jgi:hypothetical protein
MEIDNTLRGPFGTFYSEKEIAEVWDLLTEAFQHYECYDPKVRLVHNVRGLIGSHMLDAQEMERQRVINTNVWFYDKESFKFGDLHIETIKEKK